VKDIANRSSSEKYTKNITICIHFTGEAKFSVHPHIYRVSQEECARLREGVPHVKV